MFSGSIVRLLARWRSTRTEHRAIARGIFVVAGFALIARFLGAAKEIAVAWRYGVGAEVDAYLLGFNLVSWPVGIASSVLPVVVLPLLTRMRGENPAGVRRFMAESLGLTIAVGAAVSLVTLLVLPPMVAGAWFGLPSATATMAAEIAPKLAWYPIAGMLAALMIQTA